MSPHPGAARMTTDVNRARSRWHALALAVLCAAVGLVADRVRAQGAPAWNVVGPPGGNVTALLRDPLSSSTVYAATAENGVFFSTDAGTTWLATNAGLTRSTSGRRLVIAVNALATDGSFVYAATDAGLYARAAGSSGAWTALPGPPVATPITLLAYEALSGRLYAASTTTDGLAMPTVFVASLAPAWPPVSAWSASPLPMAAGSVVSTLAIAPADLAGIAHVIATVDNRVFAASIAGADPSLAWSDADPSGYLGAGTLTAATYAPEFQQAYACSGTALYASGNPFDASPLWLLSSAGPLDCLAFASVPIANGGLPQLLLGAMQGPFVSVDGTTFAATAAPPGTRITNGFALAQAPGSADWTVLAATTFGIAATPVSGLGAGVAWTQRNGPSSVAAGGGNGRLNNVNVLDTAWLGTTLYALCAANGYADVQASSDGGATWSSTGIGTVLQAGETVIALAADSTNSVLYAGTTQGVLAYQAASATWSAVAPAIVAGRAAALAVGSSAVFVGTDQGVYAIPKSATPAGAVPIAAGLTAYSVRALLVSGASLYSAGIDASDQNLVFVTDEAGATHGTGVWTSFGTTPTGTDRITSLLAIGTTVLASTAGGGVLYASAGSGWASANTSNDPAQQITDPFGIVNALFSDGTSVYAATGNNGIFVSPLGTTFSWTPFNGTAPGALASLEVHSLHADAGVIYAGTRAGVAVFGTPSAAPAPAPPPSSPAPPPSSPASSSEGGGGSTDSAFLALLLAGVALAWRAGRR